MRTVFSLLLIIGGLCGIAVSFLSKIVVNSTLTFIDGWELSIWLGLFFIVAFLTGIYYLLATD